VRFFKLQQRVPKTNNFLPFLEELPIHEHRCNEAREEYRSEQFILRVILLKENGVTKYPRMKSVYAHSKDTSNFVRFILL
jgi:hypothetical protein